MMRLDVAMLRTMLLREGISFYQLEEKPSITDHKFLSEARFRMVQSGITVQDLKNGSIYAGLERDGLSREEIDKYVKAMLAKDKEEAAKISSYAEKYCCRNITNNKGKVYTRGEFRDYIRSKYYDDPHVRMDIKLHGSLDYKFDVSNKTIRKPDKLDKKKKLAARN